MLEKLDDLGGLEALASACVGVHDERFDFVGSRDVEHGFDAGRQAIEAFAFGAMVFQGALAVGLGHGDDVRLANFAFTNENDVRQVHRAAREQHAAHVAAVLVVVGRFHTAQNGIEVAFGTQNLLGAERAVLVGAAGARVRNGVDDGGFALRTAKRGGGEIGGHLGFGCLRGGLGQFERERVAVFVNNSGIDGRLGFFGECAFHKSQMLGGFSAALVASGHDFLPWSEFRFRRRL